jgi:hypothetical protein
MSDEVVVENPPRTHSGALLGAIAVALLLALGGLIWSYTLSGKLATQQTELDGAKAKNVNLEAQLRETDARLKVATDELSSKLGLTQMQLDAKAGAIMAREQRTEENTAKLATAQQQTAQQVTQVSSAVTDVKTDVGGVKTDLGQTKTDLASAVAQLTSMKGDLSQHSSLIARNHDELDVLRHKGDRTYYEFTLAKGVKKPVGTISLELKKTDPKKNRFTLVVYADDKMVEKKDKNLNEPLQFYAGKDPLLFEVVVNSVSTNNTVSGYLSVPKTAPAPASTGE